MADKRPACSTQVVELFWLGCLTTNRKHPIIAGSVVNGHNASSAERLAVAVNAALDENREAAQNSASLLAVNKAIRQHDKARIAKLKGLTEIAKQIIIPLLCCRKHNDLQTVESKAKANEFCSSLKINSR